METRGQVNAYVPYKSEGPSVHTINLADGTTPFIKHFQGREHASASYRLGCATRLTLQYAWYRPAREEFDALDEHAQGHVTNGGLLCADLQTALDRQLKGDPVQANWSYETFQEWCRQVYGVRRPPLPDRPQQPSN